MIFDKQENLDRYQLPQKEFGKLLDFLKNFKETDFQAGRFEIDGDRFFGIGLEYQTKKAEEGLWEAHRKNIDVHYILEGEERVQISDIEEMQVTKEYEEEGDYVLFDGAASDAVILRKGEILILFPNEIHKTSIMVNEPVEIRKIVFKIRFK